VVSVYLYHKGKVMDLPNTYEDGHMCIGSFDTKCEADYDSIKAWVKNYICSKWSGDLERSQEYFATTTELFKWLETKHKNYRKIMRK
jgi:hypothetical protein